MKKFLQGSIVVILSIMILYTMPDAVADTQLTISAPTNEKVLSWDKSLEVEWNEITGAEGYYIAIKDVEDGTYLLATTYTEDTDYYIAKKNIPKQARRYKIWVGAVDSASAAPASAFTAHEIYITIANKPEITNGTSSQITKNSVKLSMSLDKNNGNAVSDCGFYFGTSPTRSRMTKYSFRDYGTYDVSTKETKYMTISTLTQGTEYYYRAYAVNEVGEEYTDAESFTTLDDVLADPVIYFPENQTTGTAGESIAIHWYEVANVDGYRYHIKQLSGEPDNSNNESSINYWTGSTSSKHYTLDGENVKGGYWYKFVVEAYADGYNSSWSDAVYVFIPSLPESTATPRIDPDPTPKPTTIPDNTATPHIGSDPTPGPTLQVDYKLLTLPSSLIIIEEEAFYGNTAIEKVILPGRIKEIRSLAFANSSIKEINLPDSLEYIADNAFSGTNLKKVTANQGTKAYDWAVDHGYIIPDSSSFIVKKGNETIIAQGATSSSFACNPSAGLNDVATFTVVTNYDWTVSASNTNWMSVKKTNATTAVVTIGTVQDGASYSSTLTFTANGKNYSVLVTLNKTATASAPVVKNSVTNETYTAENIVEYNRNKGGFNLTYSSTNGSGKYHITAIIINEEPLFDDSEYANNQKNSEQTVKTLYDDDTTNTSMPFALADLQLGSYLKIAVGAYSRGNTSTAADAWTVFGIKLINNQPVVVPADTETNFAGRIWSQLKDWGFTDEQAAGIMGNINAESVYCPYNAEDGYGFSGVDNRNDYIFKVDDAVGFGLCQWTTKNRKTGLKSSAENGGWTVWDFDAQMNYLLWELNTNYYSNQTWMTYFKSQTTIREAAVAWMKVFENPADQSTSAQNYRTSLAQTAYNTYAGSSGTSDPDPEFLSAITVSGGTYAGDTYTMKFDTSTSVSYVVVCYESGNTIKEKNGKFYASTYGNATSSTISWSIPYQFEHTGENNRTVILRCYNSGGDYATKTSKSFTCMANTDIQKVKQQSIVNRAYQYMYPECEAYYAEGIPYYVHGSTVKTIPAGWYLHGVPYTVQTGTDYCRNTLEKYLNRTYAQKKEYSTYTYSNATTTEKTRTGVKYGLDCTGFCLDCWNAIDSYGMSGSFSGTVKKSAYRYALSSQSDLKKAQPGDVLQNSGHVMLVISNNTSTSKLVIIEQTAANGSTLSCECSGCTSGEVATLGTRQLTYSYSSVYPTYTYLYRHEDCMSSSDTSGWSSPGSY